MLRRYSIYLPLIISALLVTTVVIGAGVLLAGLDDKRSPSQYQGQVVDLENERGLLFPTTQVHIKTDRRSSEHETFCIIDENRDEQLPVLRKAVTEDYWITITYERPRYVPIWECQSGTSIITDITVQEPADA